MDYQNTLDKKSNEYYNLCRQLHKLLSTNNLLEIEDILNKYDINILVNLHNKGLISLLLQYAIIICNDDIINIIKPYISMKRDYLQLILYYASNKSNIDICKEIFVTNIDKDTILDKDINFLIDNELYFLLPYLEGVFIKFDLDGFQYEDVKFKKFYLQDTQRYMKKIQKNIKSNLIKEITEDYDYIIDAGNVLFSRNGVLNNNSIKDLEFVINNFPKSLIIIHQNHLKNEKIKNLISGKLYYVTPKYINDDIFIIMAFLHKQVNIITNDNFKDHTIDDITFRNYINDSLIKYENNKGNIIFDKILPYSKCIQVVNNITYIPCTNGFIAITVK